MFYSSCLFGHAQSTVQPLPKSTLSESCVIGTFQNTSDVNNFGHEYTFNKTNPSIWLLACFNFTNRSSFAFGITHYIVSFQLKYNWIAIDANDPLLPIRKDVDLGFTEFPLIYQYRFIHRNKFAAYTSIGFIESIRHSGRATTFLAGGTEQNSSDMSKYVASYHLGLGTLYRTKSGIIIRAESAYRYYRNAFEVGMKPVTQSFTYSLGFDLPIDWKCFFKKDAWKPLPTCD